MPFPPAPPQNRGKNHIWKYFPDFACGVIFWIIVYKQQFLHSDCLKTSQLIHPKSVEFHPGHAKPHSICLYHNIKDNEGNIRQDLLTIENTDSDLKVHALHYANDCLYASDFPFKNNKKKTFELKKALRDTLTRAAWLGPSNVWLVRSEHAHASYPGLSFRPPGFSPYMGREERRVQGLD